MRKSDSSKPASPTSCNAGDSHTEIESRRIDSANIAEGNINHVHHSDGAKALGWFLAGVAAGVGALVTLLIFAIGFVFIFQAIT